MSLQEIRESMGAMLSEEEKERLEELGKRYFEHIDVDKYKPVRAEEYKEEFIVDSDRFSFQRIVLSLQSGLDYDDLTDQEKDLFTRMNK
jgi:hypothetical protein